MARRDIFGDTHMGFFIFFWLNDKGLIQLPPRAPPWGPLGVTPQPGQAWGVPCPPQPEPARSPRGLRWHRGPIPGMERG